MKTRRNVTIRIGGGVMCVVGLVCLLFALVARKELVSESGLGWYVAAMLLCCAVVVFGWLACVGIVAKWFNRLASWGSGVSSENGGK